MSCAMGDTAFLSRDEWHLVVEKCLEVKEFEVLDSVLHPLGSTGGFLGEHFTADIKVRLHTKENAEKILHFFVKTEPKRDEGQRKITKEINAFKKEVDTLEILFVKIRSILKEEGKNMIWACKNYYIRPDLIVQEDLSKQGFRTFTMRDSLRYEHFALTMEALANMHAASVIFEEKQPTQPYHLIDEYPEVFEESFFRHAQGHPGTRWLITSVKTVWFLVELIRGKEALNRMKTDLEKIVWSLYDLEKPSDRYRNVLCQGDVKRDNILFRHDGDVPVEVRIVDYQFTRYAPPANDIMCFLYLSSNREFRQKYASRLLSVYYDRFSNNLRENGLDSKSVLSWEEFKESCDFYKTLGIIIASCYGPGTFMKAEDISHVFTTDAFERFLLDDRGPEVLYSFKNDPFYKKNVTEIIEELIECVEK